jgi:hypothetical protein
MKLSKIQKRQARRQKLVDLIKLRAPTLFERMPRTSVATSMVEKLADEILES